MSAPQAAALPWALPKTTADWAAFVNSLNSWRPQAPLWQALTLQNSWIPYGGPSNASPQYQLDNFGRVFCRGLIRGGTVTDGTVISTIPLAPSKQLYTIGLGFNGTTSAPVSIDVDTSGNILLFGASSFSGTYFISLDQLNYSLSP
jgi:hypothetical protein